MRQKRLTIPKEILIKRKGIPYITCPRGGRTGVKIALLTLIRDILSFANTASEAKKIITGKKVLVDGKICTDRKFGLGFMDVVSFPDLKKHYRITIKSHITPIEISESESKLKLCKIIRKQSVKGGKIQITLHDGRNIQNNNLNYHVGDSLLIKIPEQEIKEHLEFKEGMLVFITGGKRKGQFAYIKEIIRGINPRVILTFNGNDFEASSKDIIVVGIEKPLIQIV
ncbi:MAG: S4 domain-containing protein [Candidatus Aenigmatarchaeota archaeon]|nr:30S ribosomal protein S4e [Candidatus Aenigmarchaeota archaeon]